MAQAELGDRAAWPDRARAAINRLPAGTVAAARASLLRGLEAAGTVGERRNWLDDAWLEARLVAPLVLEADWPPPAPPMPVGDGAVHANLFGPDLEVFDRLQTALAAEPGKQEVVECLAPEPGERQIAAERPPAEPYMRLPVKQGERGTAAERLAAEAQIWRLPVTPYRRIDQVLRFFAAQAGWPTSMGEDGGHDLRERPIRSGTAGDRDRQERRPRRRDQPLVVDLTALWAGPLATALLADLGAEVVKVEPSVRPDGTARHPAFHGHLNSVKQVVDLDLREGPDRRRFEALLDRADLVIDSFSRRVMPNFGYGRPVLAARWPRLAALSITAFPASAVEADWIAYGPGVHAVMGLGDRGPGRAFEPAPVAYPDALAGLSAFAAAAELLTRGPAAPVGPEVSLAAAVAPLTRLAAATPALAQMTEPV